MLRLYGFCSVLEVCWLYVAFGMSICLVSAGTVKGEVMDLGMIATAPKKSRDGQVSGLRIAVPLHC